MKKILVGVAASALCMVAQAEEQNALVDFLHGTYNGGGLGLTKISNYCPPGAYVCNDMRDLSFKVYGGLRMTDYLSSEIGFVSFGRIRSLIQPPTGYGRSSELSTRTNGFVFNLAPVFNLSPRSSVITRFGLARWHIEGNNGDVPIQESKTAPYIGAAYDYKIRELIPGVLQPYLKTFSVQVSWDATRTEIQTTDHWYNMVSLGTQFEF